MPASPPASAFAYAVIRIVPQVQRGEGFNAGVVLFCRQLDFLGARVALDELRLAALAPGVSPDAIRPHLKAIVRIADGDRGSGPIAALPASDRFGWLASPSSTIIQPSPIHTGLSEDPRATLESLFAELVG
jgi:hypothetical protein